LVADHVAELGPVGHARRQPHLSPRLGLALEHGDLVPGAGRGDRRLEPAGTGAGHEHPPLLSFRTGPIGPVSKDRTGFAAGPRVLDAPEPAVEAHPPDALLVARQAEPDLLRRPA